MTWNQHVTFMTDNFLHYSWTQYKSNKISVLKLKGLTRLIKYVNHSWSI